MATQSNPPSDGVLSTPPQLTSDPEKASIQTAVVAQADPFIGRTLRVTNPFDEAILYRLESAIDIDTLNNTTAFSEAVFSAEVFDTGGEVGAELEYSVGHTLRQIGSEERLSVPMFFEGTVIAGETDAHKQSAAGFGLGEDFDEILQSAFLTVSPGDTAVLTSIASFGDAEVPLVPLDDIRVALDLVDEFATNFEGVPDGILGDFDLNSTLDENDIELLSAAVRDNSSDLLFDVTNDETIDQADRRVWVNELKNTFFGDSNLDGEFNSSDLINVFSLGRFETGSDATWQAGDWDGDGKFTTSDIIAAFADGGYEQGPRVATATVPEPSNPIAIFLVGMVTMACFRR